MPHQDSLTLPLAGWYQTAKRDLPWRQTKDPYRIWISEIMLQQTRVETVKGYYQRFLQLFPTVAALAAAQEQPVLKAWEGLGYYSRARNLQKAARTIMTDYSGQFPHTYELLLSLPGIGPYTAGAIASIAFDQRVPAVDGNVYRVAARFFGIRKDIGSPATQKELRNLVMDSLPMEGVSDHNQALMELGATVCLPKAPRCEQCPLTGTCDAFAEKDAHLLPLHLKKPPPKVMDVAVCLLTFENQILVVRREQRMLHGLYVFHLLENESDPPLVLGLLAQQGFVCNFASNLGVARHVFTHRIWEMKILHFLLQKQPAQQSLDALHGRMVDQEALLALPFPTAMKTAREKARELLSHAQHD